METVDLGHKGYAITYLKVRLDTGGWTVNVASNNLGLLNKLRGKTVFQDGQSLEGIGKSKAIY
jgi:hypothetical protein